jgi:hypothetical protein
LVDDEKAIFSVVVVLIPTLLHFTYSRFGYTPTDDGFIFAYSRRVLAGQIPHRDFIFIRPVGSALLHAPFVLLAGDRLFLASRWFVWMQFGAIAWSWIRAARRLGAPLGFFEASCVAAIAIALSAHTFPMMAWYTIDGIFLASIGFALSLEERERTRLIGYALVGASALCKQNFAVMPIAVLLLGKERLNFKAWIATASPGVLYALIVAAFGGLRDMIHQLTALGGFHAVGIDVYATSELFPWGIGLGWVAISVGRDARFSLVRSIGTACVAIFIAWSAKHLSEGLYVTSCAFFLFGCALGATFHHGFAVRRSDFAHLGFLACLLAWCTSISIGYNSPALAAGPLFIAYWTPLSANQAWWARVLALMLVASQLRAGFEKARTQAIYRQPSVAMLDTNLDGVLPGGKGILTNTTTARFIADVPNAIALAQGRPYAIIPDFPGWWARATQRNPLLVDWVYQQELPSEELVQRVIADMESKRGRIVVLSQNFAADGLGSGEYAFRWGYSPILDHVRRNWRVLGATHYFTAYE